VKYYESISHLANKLAEIKKTNQPLVHAEQLEFELREILREADYLQKVHSEKYRLRLEAWKETRLELARAVIGFGQTAIRSLFLINGGALIALLTFLGQLSDQRPDEAAAFSTPMLYFSVGLISVCVVAMLAYIVQSIYEARGRFLRIGKGLHIASLFFAASSLAAFTVGILDAYSIFAAMD
jgi:hypothetical protein